MDLPTTDPGSDFCDYTDSADEATCCYYRSATETKGVESSDEENSEKKLILPMIARPRSLSFNEDIVTTNSNKKINNDSSKRRYYHRCRLPRSVLRFILLFAKTTTVQRKIIN